MGKVTPRKSRQASALIVLCAMLWTLLVPMAWAAPAPTAQTAQAGGESYEPRQSTSRAEFATAINRLLTRGPLKGRPSNRWSDVPSSHWASGDVEEASVPHEFEAALGPSETWVQDK